MIFSNLFENENLSLKRKKVIETHKIPDYLHFPVTYWHPYGFYLFYVRIWLQIKSTLSMKHKGLATYKRGFYTRNFIHLFVLAAE